MNALLEVSLLYLTISSLAGGLYYLHLKNTSSHIPRGRLLTFSLLTFPPSWIALSVILGATGIYYRLLPNNDSALLISASLSLFPAAALAHWGT